MSHKASYDELIKRVKEVSLIGSCEAVLGWDERTYMPPDGSKHRAEQLTLLSGMMHSKFTDPKIGELLSECEQSDLVKDPESFEAVNIREIRHQYDKRTKLPQDLVEELTKVTTLAQGEWVKARANKDFKAFLPWLEKVVALTKDKADAYGYENERYDSLLDDYEPGAKTLEVEETFSNLRDELVILLDKIKGAPKKPDVSIIERKYDVGLQRVFGESVAQAIGFDFNKGRLDITTHPFCSGFGPGDTRITTRYNPNRLNDALFGTMHETGHALYDMGIDQETHYGTPMGEANSLGIHESQSRTWENQVGRSKSFWKYFFPQAQRIFKDSLGNVTLDDFYGAINNVSPSYIRVEADEATYNLHILLRFELERGLMSGEIAPADIRDAWNERFKNYFGMEVDHDSNGCLQDVHWSAGYIGYFPTYCLGNLFSAQFFAKAQEDLGDLDSQFANGNYSVFLQWLRDNIHIHGSRYRATDLVKRVTGQPLSYKPLIDYMTAKFADIYGF
jgi:carboxypeptidase Taq